MRVMGITRVLCLVGKGGVVEQVVMGARSLIGWWGEGAWEV
jgi:hypothetical protein